MRSANDKTFTCHRCLQSKLVYKVAVHLSTPDLTVKSSNNIRVFARIPLLRMYKVNDADQSRSTFNIVWYMARSIRSKQLAYTMNSYYFTMTYNLANCWLPHSLLQAAINCKWPKGQPREALLCFTSHLFQYRHWVLGSWTCEFGYCVVCHYLLMAVTWL